MIFTNTKNLPALLVNAIKNENAKYSRGKADISVTQLIDAPMQRILKNKYLDEITEDISERLWAFFGSMGHSIIANIDADSVLLKEKRFYIDIKEWVVSGQPDLYYKDEKGDRVLCDFKVTSKYAVKDGAKPEYVKQLNTYRYMLEEHNFPVDRMEIVAIVRDAGFIDDKVVVLPVKQFKTYKIKEYLEKRVAMHRLYSDELIGKVPECTPKERWQNPDKHCIMKEGNTKQTGRDYDTDDQALEFMADLYIRHPKDKYYLKVKSQTAKRCEGYCSVNKFCWAYQEFKKTGVFPDSTKEVEGKVISP